MYYNEKTVLLKNGTECTLRNPRESEALECDDRMLLAAWINEKLIGSIGVNRVSPHSKM